MAPRWEFEDREIQLAAQARDEAQERADARRDYYDEPRFSRSEIAEMNAEARRDR